jgi:hypothetical protein
VIGPADALVDVVGASLVVHEVRHCLRERHVLVGIDLPFAHAESGAAQQVIDFWIQSSHEESLDGQTVMVITPSAKVLAYWRRLARAGPCCTCPFRLYRDP